MKKLRKTTELEKDIVCLMQGYLGVLFCSYMGVLMINHINLLEASL